MADCCLCGKVDSDHNICDRCGYWYCEACFDHDENLCLKCVQEQ